MVSMRHGCLDGAARDAEVFLCAEEDVVPEAGFEMRLHFGEIEVRAGAARDELFGVVEEIEGEVEDAAGHRLRRRPRCDVLQDASRAARTKRTAGFSLRV